MHSFSSKTKQELCKLTGFELCCRRAELAGIIAFAGSFDGNEIRINTESSPVARHLHNLVKELFEVQAENKIKNMGRLHLYTVIIPDAYLVLEKLGIGLMPMRVQSSVVKRDCCCRAFVRGAFLGAGSISAPEKTYHMEIITRHLKISENFGNLIERFEIKPKVTMRKGNHVYYFKGSEAISDMLVLLGAHNSMMEFLNVKIVKEMRNHANRLVNCETANVDKAINASMEQVRIIQEIDQKIGLGNLPPELEKLARLRVENPEDSIRELGERYEPVISKSCVNHRLNRIIEYYKEKL